VAFYVSSVRPRGHTPTNRNGIPKAEPASGDVDLRKRGERPKQNAVVENGLRRAGLWNKVRTRLPHRARALPGDQQQRLRIARSLAVNPDVLLIAEPCSALSPTSTPGIEKTIAELATEVTVVIVTHNMQQVARLSQHCAFFLAEENMPGLVVESGPTARLFDGLADARTATRCAVAFE
jgi:phosphate transport system ATP-binding protein